MNSSQPSPAALPTAVSALPVAAVKSAVQLRVEHLLVRTGPRVLYQLMRVGPAGLCGLAAFAAAAIASVTLLLPAHRSVATLRGELNRAGHPAPTVAAAGPQVARSPGQFAASLPTREQVPALLGLVMVQATDAGIALDQGKYVFVPPASGRLAKYSFEFPVKGEYGNIRAFINKVLAAIPALGLEKLQIERKNVGDTAVNADLEFVIYLRGA